MNKTPAVRFIGFAEDWEQRKFGDIVQTRRGLTYKPTDIEESGIRVLRSSNIDENTFVYGVDDVFVNPYAVNIEPVRKNDILITSANGSSRMVGKHALIKKISDGSAVHGGFMLLGRTKNYDFVNASMSSSWYTKFINVFAAGGNGAIGNLNKNDLDEQVILIPDDAEQIKIGEYFAALDNLITLHQRKYDKLTNVKKSMLEKMFPKNGSNVPEIRFKGFTDAWEQRKFSDIAARESSVSTTASDIPSVEYEDVVAEEGRLNKDIRLKEAVKSGITFDGSQVLYGKLRPYLHNWLNPDFKGIAVGDWWVLKPINMDKNFLYRLIQTQQFDNIANQSSGSKMPRADWNLISNSEFVVPLSKEEQSKIGVYFDSLDNLITLHHRKLEKLEQIKQAMLHKMFV